MKTLFSFALLLSTTVHCFAQQQGAKNTKALDKRLEKITTDFKVAGYAVAVVRGHELIYCKGFGYRDYEQKKPVTPNTVFPIGSCTKAFTAALIGQLQKENKLSLDGKARTYLPQLKFNSDALNNEVTVRDLMCHRTGLARYDFSWYMFSTSNRDSLLARIQYMEPNAALRETWQYNNFMFLAQGMIAEKLTNKSWEQNIKERLFDSLDMPHSSTGLADLQKEAEVSLPYGLDNGIVQVPYHNLEAMGPAGSINSNVLDMSHWVSAWLNGGLYKGRSVLPPSYLRGALRSQMTMGDGIPREHPELQFSEYGFGWMLHSYRGHYQAEHGGNVDGFTANVGLYPNDSLGIVILTNQGNSVTTTIIRNILSDYFLKLPPEDWSGEAFEKLKKMQLQAQNEVPGPDTLRIPNTKPSHALNDYAGSYTHPAYGQFSVFVKNDSLYTNALGKDLIWLRHYHYDVFEMIMDKEKNKPNAGENLHMQFFFDDKGRIKEVQTPFAEDGIKAPVFVHKH